MLRLMGGAPAAQSDGPKLVELSIGVGLGRYNFALISATIGSSCAVQVYERLKRDCHHVGVVVYVEELVLLGSSTSSSA